MIKVENLELEEVIQSILKEVLGNARIGDVFVAPAYDEDGDEILLVKVELGGTEDQSDARKATSAGRQMRLHLAEIGQQAFPNISCLSSDEMHESQDAAR